MRATVIRYNRSGGDSHVIPYEPSEPWSVDAQGHFIVKGPIASQTLLSQWWLPDDAPVRRVGPEGSHDLLWKDLVDAVPLGADEQWVLPCDPRQTGPLLYVMERLLGPGGCPWDQAQTPRSLLRYMLDEAYEAAAAIVSEDVELVRDELGDVLLQVVLQSGLGQRAGLFTFEDVARQQAQKLVRRHPHVFSDATVTSGADVIQRWEGLKAQEPVKGNGDESVMPALMAASRRLKRGALQPSEPARGFIEALRDAGTSRSDGERRRLLSDMLLAAVSVGREWHLEAEWVLWEAIQSE